MQERPGQRIHMYRLKYEHIFGWYKFRKLALKREAGTRNCEPREIFPLYIPYTCKETLYIHGGVTRGAHV